MKLHLINQFGLEIDGQMVRRLRTRKAEELLAYLALHQERWISRAEAIDVVWQESDEGASRQKLRLALHSIRSLLGERLETDGDLVRVANVEVDFLDGGLLNISPGWRLMPEHQIDWLDLKAASAQSENQLAALAMLDTPNSPDSRARSLAFLIAADPNEPQFYVDLFQHYQQFKNRVAAGVVASFARQNLGHNCPDVLREFRSKRYRSDFQGRLGDLTLLAEILLGDDEPACVQLTGIGGIGKTRLATELADLARDEDISVAWVQLTGVETPQQAEVEALNALANTLQIEPEEARNPQEIFSVLWVLDNADQLPVDGLAFLNPYLQSGCGTRILITTQRPLDVPGTRILLPPLGLPQGESIEQAEASEAVNLFLHHSERVLRAEDIGTLIPIVQETGGIPLALRMVGFEARSRSLESVLDGLRGVSHSLKYRGNAPETPGRHMSLEAVLQWGYGLLDDSHRLGLQIAAFCEDTFDQALLVALGVAPKVVLALIEFGWFIASKERDIYSMLPPARQFLREQNIDQESRLRTQIRDSFAETIASNYPDRYEEVARIGEVYPQDLWRYIDGNDYRDTRQLGSLLVGLSVTCHRHARENYVVGRLAAVVQETPHLPWINLIGSIEYVRYNFDAAEPHFKRLAESDDPELCGVGQVNLGLIALCNGEYEVALPQLQSAIGLTSNPRRKWTRVLNYGNGLLMRGDYETALEQVEQVIASLEEVVGLEGVLGLAYLRRAEIWYFLGEYEKALASTFVADEIWQRHHQWHYIEELYFVQLSIYVGTKNWEQERRCGEKLVDRRPNPATLVTELYILLTVHGRTDLASLFACAMQRNRLPLFCQHLAFVAGLELNSFAPIPRRSEAYALARHALKHL